MTAAKYTKTQTRLVTRFQAGGQHVQEHTHTLHACRALALPCSSVRDFRPVCFGRTIYQDQALTTWSECICTFKPMTFCRSPAIEIFCLIAFVTVFHYIILSICNTSALLRLHIIIIIGIAQRYVVAFLCTFDFSTILFEGWIPYCIAVLQQGSG